MMKKLKVFLALFFVMVAFFIQVIFFQLLLFFIFFIFFYFKEKKNLFSCGDNNINQKGIFYDSQNLKIPTKIDFFKDIEVNQIFTGYSSTFIKTKSYSF
jgi:hypothetical protein